MTHIFSLFQRESMNCIKIVTGLNAASYCSFFWYICDIERDTPEKNKTKQEDKLVYWQWEMSQLPTLRWATCI